MHKARFIEVRMFIILFAEFFIYMFLFFHFGLLGTKLILLLLSFFRFFKLYTLHVVNLTNLGPAHQQGTTKVETHFAEITCVTIALSL